MVWMPPGSAKSTYASILFPPYFMGHHPKVPILGVSNTTELAERFSRRARNLVSSQRYRNVFGFGCAEDSKAAGSWENERGGEFFAAGIGSAIAGRRAGLGLIDDPVKSREEADSERVRDKHWDWYLNDFLTRLLPGAPQIVIQCMTGDTHVLMGDGTQKPLREIRIGDSVASYDRGVLASSKVLNWANQGSDCVLAITTKSGITVRANERHPFLVERNGVREWIRVKNLAYGDKIVRAEVRWWGSNAQNATSQLEQKATVHRITTKPSGRAGIALHRLMRRLTDRLTFVTGTVSIWANTMQSWMLKAGCVLSADSHPERTFVPIGAGNSALTMITLQGRFAAYSATTATSPLDTGKQRQSCEQQQNICEFTADEVVSIVPAGCEDVFDIQVQGTENFIANGLVSHNTRWHESDLSGRILEREGDRWHILKLPMEAIADDPLGRPIGERLWPEWFTDDMVKTAKMDVRAWNALYQQNPVPDDGEYFKRDMFNAYNQPPQGMHIYGASDYAVTEGGGDYTEHGIFGLDFNGDLYVLDWWREQAASNVWIERQCDLIAQWKPLIWFGEAGPIRKAIEPFLKRRMIERQTPCRLEWLPSIADKVVRARSFQARASMGNVFIPDHSQWLPDLMSQLMRFPAGKYDDGVDVCSLIGRGLEYARPPEMKAPPSPATPRYANRQDSLGWMGN